MLPGEPIQPRQAVGGGLTLPPLPGSLVAPEPPPGDLQLSIANTRYLPWVEQIEGYFASNGSIKSSDSLYLGISPIELADKGIEPAPLYIPTSVLNKAVRNPRGSRSGHSLTKEQLLQLKKGIEVAPAIIHNPTRNSLLFVTDVRDNYGRYIVAAFDINKNLFGENAHKAVSIHGREGLERMLLSLGDDAVIYVANENKFNDVLPGTWIQSPQLLARIELVEPNVADRNAEVNTGGIENVQSQDGAGRPALAWAGGAGGFGAEGGAGGLNGSGGDVGSKRGVLFDGGGERDVGARSGGQAGGMAEGPGRDQGREVQAGRAGARRAYVENLWGNGQVSSFSAADIGLKNGSDAKTAQVLPQGGYDDEAVECVRMLEQAGAEAVLFTGLLMSPGGSIINGVLVGNKAYIQADSLKWSVRQISLHELFHLIARGNPGLVEGLYDMIRERFPVGEFREVAKLYESGYRGAYDMGDPAGVLKIVEEVAADVFARKNSFSTDIMQYGGVVGQALGAPGVALPGGREAAAAVDRATGPPVMGGEFGGAYSISADFDDKFDSWVASGKPNERRLVIGSTSQALKSISIDDKSIVWDTSKINKIQRDHPGMSDGVIRQVPDIIERPVLVMDSKTWPNRVTMFGEVYNDNGLPVMAVLELLPMGRSGYALDAIKVANAYSKDRGGIAGTQGVINSSNILYIDPHKNRTDSWLSHNQLQLPFGITEYGPIGKVSYIPRDVNGNFSSDGAASDLPEWKRQLLDWQNAGQENAGDVDTKYSLDGSGLRAPELAGEPDVPSRKELARDERDSARKLKNSLVKSFSIQPGGRAQAREDIGRLIGELDRGRVDPARLWDTFTGLFDAGRVLSDGNVDFRDAAASLLQGRKIYISPEVKSEYADDDWNRIKQRAFGRGLSFTDDAGGVGLDTAFQELSGSIPGWFDSGETDPAKMIDAIMNVLENSKPLMVSLEDEALRYGGDEAAAAYKTQMYGEFLDDVGAYYNSVHGARAERESAIGEVREQNSRALREYGQVVRSHIEGRAGGGEGGAVAGQV